MFNVVVGGSCYGSFLTDLSFFTLFKFLKQNPNQNPNPTKKTHKDTAEQRKRHGKQFFPKVTIKSMTF